jgi:thiol:disulfide interchange protein DsbC
MNFFRILLAGIFLCALGGSHAQDAKPGDTAKMGEAELKIKQLLESRLRPGTKVDGVVKTPYMGLYEARIGSELIYTDAKVEYLFAGSVLDAKTMDNLTEERVNQLSSIKWEELPLQNAFKQVNGNGKRQIAYFADPNCGYCKRFEQQALAQLKDTTIHVFVYPILSPDSTVKAKSIWCSKDKLKTWNDWMIKGQAPTASGNCENPIEANQALGQRINVRATPTVFLMNGQKVPGAIPLAQLEKLVAEANVAVKQ